MSALVWRRGLIHEEVLTAHFVAQTWPAAAEDGRYFWRIQSVEGSIAYGYAKSRQASVRVIEVLVEALEAAVETL